jgi:hypothetical protein
MDNMDTLPLQLYGITLFSGPKNNRSVTGLEAASLHQVLFLLRGRMPCFVEKLPSYGILHQLEKTVLAICYARK